MINYYDYDLEYKNYLAKKELLDELSIIQLKYSSSVLLEADGEQVKRLSTESIMKYIRKVIANIQEAWNKFKVTIENQAWLKMKKYYDKAYQTDRPLSVSASNENDRLPLLDNVVKFITGKDGTITANDLSNFSNKEEMIKLLFPYFKEAKGTNKAAFQEIIDKNCFRNITNTETIRLDNIKSYIEFIDKYPDHAKAIEADIKRLNDSTNLIERLVKSNQQDQQQTQQSAPQNNQQQTAESMIDQVQNQIYSYLIELQFADQADPNGEALKKVNKDKSLSKDVTDFYQIFTSVLSIKMATLSKAKNISFNICKSYGKNANKYLGITNKEEPTDQNTEKKEAEQ